MFSIFVVTSSLSVGYLELYYLIFEHLGYPSSYDFVSSLILLEWEEYV